MALSNLDTVGTAVRLLGSGLGPYVDRRMTTRTPVGGHWKVAYPGKNIETDASALIGVMLDYWPTVFKDDLKTLGRTLVGEAKHWRDTSAHNNPISYDDAFRALDSIERLLVLVGAPEATEVRRLRKELIDPEKEEPREPAAPGAAPSRTPTGLPSRGPNRDLATSAKYEPLRKHLAGLHEPLVRLTFVQIEQIIGTPLPASARRHNAWWANGGHAHSSAWIGAGRRTANIDLNGGTVDFVR
jgi:hypothetical protein